jgi:hypothetical protein
MAPIAIPQARPMSRPTAAISAPSSITARLSMRRLKPSAPSVASSRARKPDAGGQRHRQPEEADQHRRGFERVGDGKALVEDRQAQLANLGSVGEFESVLTGPRRQPGAAAASWPGRGQSARSVGWKSPPRRW